MHTFFYDEITFEMDSNLLDRLVSVFHISPTIPNVDDDLDVVRCSHQTLMRTSNKEESFLKTNTSGVSDFDHTCISPTSSNTKGAQ